MEPSRKRAKVDYTTDVQLSGGSFPNYTCWRPEEDSNIIRDPGYKTFRAISRVLHFQDYKEVYEKQALIPQELTDASHSSMPKTLKGLWFGIAPEERDLSHNWYGNVSCQINFEDFLETFKPKCYFPEIVEFKKSTSPRLVLTTQDIADDLNIPEYKQECYGGPWWKDEDGAHHCLQHTRRFKSRGFKRTDWEYDYFPCDIEMFIVLSDEECKTLFEKCDKLAVNHRNGNIEGLHYCKKHRSRQRGEVCPSAWTIEECERKLDLLTPGENAKDESEVHNSGDDTEDTKELAEKEDNHNHAKVPEEKDVLKVEEAIEAPDPKLEEGKKLMVKDECHDQSKNFDDDI